MNNASTPKNTVYLPGLNGLRAIAALAVVISHTTLALGEFGLNNKIFGADADGNASGLTLAAHGVTIFFTLSGFLITYLLLKEKEVTRLHIKDFYIRRILRIWPLYYLYFGICLLTMLVMNMEINTGSVPFYLFLAANVPFILGGAIPLVAHYWSLGVEEQFYLFYPQIAKYSNKRLFKISLALILLLLILKMIFWVMDRRYHIHTPYLAINVTRFHTMLFGVIGAMLHYMHQPIFHKISTHKVTQIISWLVIFLMALNKFHVASVIDAEIVSVITVFLIMGQVTKQNNIINLENTVCDFIGKISYGMYVLHPLIIFYLSCMLGKFKSDSPFNYIGVYLLVTGITVLLAFLSYEFYEKKFLKLKSKYSTVKSSSTRSDT